MMPAVASAYASPRTTPPKRTYEPWADGYGATDALWSITPIRTASFARPARNTFQNNCGEIRWARSSGERCRNWGLNGLRPADHKRKGASRDCLKLFRIV